MNTRTWMKGLRVASLGLIVLEASGSFGLVHATTNTEYTGEQTLQGTNGLITYGVMNPGHSTSGSNFTNWYDTNEGLIPKPPTPVVDPFPMSGGNFDSATNCVGASFLSNVTTTNLDTGLTLPNNSCQFATQQAAEQLAALFPGSKVVAIDFTTGEDKTSSQQYELQIPGQAALEDVGLIIAEYTIDPSQVQSLVYGFPTTSPVPGDPAASSGAASASSTPGSQALAITAANVDPNNPKTVLVTGQNIGSNMDVMLFDGQSDGQSNEPTSWTQWGNAIPLTGASATGASFQLPSNQPPSGCNANQPCQVWFMLANEKTGATSPVHSLMLPSLQASVTTTTSSNPNPVTPPGTQPAAVTLVCGNVTFSANGTIGTISCSPVTWPLESLSPYYSVSYRVAAYDMTNGSQSTGGAAGPMLTFSTNPGDSYSVTVTASDGVNQVQANCGTFTATASGSAAPPAPVTPVSAPIASAPGLNNAQFVSQSIPTTMTAGQSYPVSVTMLNNGSSAWSETTMDRLGSQSPQDNLTWGLGRVMLGSGEKILSGQTKTFSFNVTAPSTPGAYNFQWGMLEELVQWFGAYSPVVSVTVNAAAKTPVIPAPVSTTPVSTTPVSTTPLPTTPAPPVAAPPISNPAIASVVITNAGVNTSYAPWAIWLQGQNVTSSMQVQLKDPQAAQNSVWATVPLVYASDGSGGTFQVPTDTLPSQCNTKGQTCAMAISLVDESGNSSNAYSISMPAATPAAATSIPPVVTVSTPVANPSGGGATDPNTQFVLNLYKTLLNRVPDSGELGYWLNELSGAMTQAQVQQAFLTSPEYCTDQVTNDYNTILGRAPDAGGLAGWVQQCTSAAMTLAQIQQGFYNSPEYISKHQPPAPVTPPPAPVAASPTLTCGNVTFSANGTMGTVSCSQVAWPLESLSPYYTVSYRVAANDLTNGTQSTGGNAVPTLIFSTNPGDQYSVTVTATDGINESQATSATATAPGASAPLAPAAPAYTCDGGWLCNGQPVTGTPNQQVCGGNLYLVACTASGWQGTDTPCTCN